MSTETVQIPDKSVVDSFLKSLRTEKTRMTYALAFRIMLEGHPETFLNMAATDRRKAEQMILDWIYENQEKLVGQLYEHIWPRLALC